MVTLVNTFTVSTTDEEFERVFKESSDFMRAQPGFVSLRLVRSLHRPGVYVNIAEWDDAASHMRVVQGPEFAPHIESLAQVASAAPGLYETVYACDRAGV